MDLIWSLCASIIAAACIIYACKAFTFNASVWGIQFKSIQKSVELTTKELAETKRHGEETITSELDRFKELYFMLHNLERFYDGILPNVGSILCDMISEALDDATLQGSRGIDIETYSRQSLEQFLQDRYDACMQSWENYNLRRQAGGSRELFMSHEDASNSIRRLAPLKLVDGAWLSHVNKISTPIALRQTTQKMWQILSEELGDGDLCKNHVHVYSRLIRETSGACPEPYSPFFIDSQHNMTDVHVWKAAVAQQLISLLPDKFLPEILGFNLHFEGVAFETLVTSRELEELNCDPSYFLLHVSIDNPHSGHSAVALETVTEFLDCVERESGAENLQVAWNRVRAGYIFSKHLDAATSRLRSPPAADLSPREEAVIKIITGKARVAQKIHCGSRIMVGSHHISHWLDRERLRERTWQTQFLQTLSNTGSLVRRGCSASSKLIKEISWGGKMFGSFTDLEVTAIRQWIDALPPKQGKSYWTFTGLCADEVAYDPRTDSQCWANAFYRKTPLIEQALRDSNDTTSPFSTSFKFNDMKATQPLNLSRMLPLWFAGLGLLENFVSVPSKVANDRSSAILRVLRAQHGLGVESGGVGGLDEALRSDRVDLIDIGLGWVDKAGLQRPQWVHTVLQGPDAVFARELITLSVRPEEHAEVLVGLSCAFVELHQAMVPFVSPPLRGALQQIAMREQCGLEEWVVDLRGIVERSMLCKAYSIGRREIAMCFN